MKTPLYALVAYVRNPVGKFVEELRRERHPEHPDWPAHITILPPRQLRGTEQEAFTTLDAVCQAVEPFEVMMGDVETFAPVTPTVFIRVAHAAYKLRELHDRLNFGPLEMGEQWPYMPHLTIAKLHDNDAARRLTDIGRQRWAAFGDSRRILVDELTFVREGQNSDWTDLAPVPLGRRLALK